jgi:hypothetical protein
MTRFQACSLSLERPIFLAKKMDTSKTHSIMPWDQNEWWVLGPDHKSVGRFWPTKKEAFDTALEFNRTPGINAVWVFRSCTNVRGE